MNNLLDSLSKAVSGFVLGWTLPSLAAVAIFILVVLPSAGYELSDNALTVTLIIGLFTLVLATMFAYASLPIYRLLEGYTLPNVVRRRFLRQRRSEVLRIDRLRKRADAARLKTYGHLENRQYYPDDPDDLMPTRLGSALRALESYGAERFGLDTQTLWYELRAVAPDALRRESDEARAAIDWFVSAAVHLALLAAASIVVAAFSGDKWLIPACVALACVLLMKPAYNNAVRNVLEWRYSVQALVNLCRKDLAAQLSLRMPPSHAAEVEMWNGLVWFVLDGDDFLMSDLDPLRISYEGGTLEASPPSAPSVERARR